MAYPPRERPMNLLMFGPLALDGIRYSRHHLTLGLAREHRVIVVDGPSELRRAASNPRQLLKNARITTDENGLERYCPPGWLPQVYRWPIVRTKLNQLRSRWLLRALGSASALPTICYVWHPQYQEAVEFLGRLPLVYHCYDK